MISLIICSRSSILSKGLISNIEETIGVPYEVINIDNSSNKYTIFEAYNLGVKRSTFSCLCFMHDDILYRTPNWGVAVLNHLNDIDIETGAIGLAGTPYQSALPGSWWGSGIIYEHIIQCDTTNPQGKFKSSGFSEKKRVVAFDGVWFCIRKQFFNKIAFDATNFNSFHHYDMDICMQMHQHGIKMFCVSDILIQHFSMGILSQDWIDSTLKFKRKWKKNLPAKCVSVSKKELCRNEFRTLNEFIWICKQNMLHQRYIYLIAMKSLFSVNSLHLYLRAPKYLLKSILNALK